MYELLSDALCDEYIGKMLYNNFHTLVKEILPIKILSEIE